MKKVILIIALLFITTPAYAGEYHFTWDKDNTKLQIPMTALWIADTLQTVYIAKHPDRFEEVGFARHFIGAHPSPEDVYAYFAGTYALTTVAIWALPPKWSHAVQSGAIVIEWTTVGGNYTFGVGIQF